jgi:hypothetical protein
MLADGSYQLDCKKPLAVCLQDLTVDVCRDYGYEVVQAKEVVDRYGVEPVNSVVVTSHAVLRCRSSSALIGGEPRRPVPVASSHPPSSTRCFPGSTQACLGPGACKGAQTCEAGGARFGTCDCGGAASAPVAAPLDTMAPPTPDGGVL